MADTFSNVSVMRSTAFLFIFGLCLATVPVTAAGPNRIKDMVDAGEILPFESIKNRVVAQSRGDYVGVELDQTNLRYRFRFLVDGNLVNVDVDARTGKLLNARKSY